MSLRRSAYPHLGVLMLETRFPRPVGDVGNPASFAMPVRHAVVRGASPQRVVRDRDPALLQPFVDAARALVDGGAAAITTGCGFLFRFQHALQAALPVPVWTSSLLLLDEVEAPGVITVDAEALRASGMVANGTSIEGLTPNCAFQRTLLDDLPMLDSDDAQHQVVAAAERLLLRDTRVRTLVLECTNMPPYAAAVAAATGRPVRHLLTLVHERWKGLAP